VPLPLFDAGLERPDEATPPGDPVAHGGGGAKGHVVTVLRTTMVVTGSGP